MRALAGGIVSGTWLIDEAAVGLAEPQSMHPRLVWIGLRPARHAAVCEVTEARLDSRLGLLGDYACGRPGRTRQVTIFREEDLFELGRRAGQVLDPALLRRNLLLRGIGLAELGAGAFCIGTAALRVTGPCRPCRRLAVSLGAATARGLSGNGGVTAEVLSGGIIRIGDLVEPAQADLFAS